MNSTKYHPVACLLRRTLLKKSTLCEEEGHRLGRRPSDTETPSCGLLGHLVSRRWCAVCSPFFCGHALSGCPFTNHLGAHGVLGSEKSGTG